MPGRAHVIVGCGGSGIKTLRRLNQLLSQDSYWRQRMDNDIYYVIVDTSVEELRKFEEGVSKDLRGASDRLHIVTVQLSHGETHLQPLVNSHMQDPFTDGRNPEGRKRLFDHWWNRGFDDPFIAPGVTPLTRGAGQCPPVSYFLTWKALKPLEEQFDKLIGEIQRRQNGFGRYDELNFLIVAGLSGGTGRGSWELIAFKLRELFMKHGTAPVPRAFLFDSSIFRNVFEERPELREQMQINALTGISQLSCWLANRREGHVNRKRSFAYQLPSLGKTPENPATDVLQVNLDVDVNNAAPVNHAYIICGDNAVSRLADSEQYYEMAGAGIYAALSKSVILDSAINSSFPVMGLATATYEVNAASLRLYFETQARVHVARMLAHAHEDQVHEKVAEFFKRTNLRVDVTNDDPVTYFRPDVRGLFLQRVLDRLDKKSNSRLGAFEQALNDDNLDESRRLVRGLMTKRDEIVEECFREVIRDERVDPTGEAGRLVKELFDQTRSVADVRRFLETIQAGLEEEWDELPTEISFGRENPVELVESLSSRSLPVFGRRFDAGERKQLLDGARRCIPRANYPAIRDQLETLYKRWTKEIDRLRENAADMLHCLSRLEQKFGRQREAVVGGNQDAFSLLFAHPEKPEEILERFSARKFYRRDLRPVLAQGDDLKLLADQVELSKELFDVTSVALGRDRQFSEGEASDVRKQLERQVEHAIESTVGIPDRFITDHFSIRRVIDGHRTAWNKRLSMKNLSHDQRTHLLERFQEVFGFQPEMNQHGHDVECEMPELEEMIFQMGASLARTCKPYWKLQSGRGKDFRVDVFVPTDKDQSTATKRINACLADPSIQVAAYSELGGQHMANPFILLAYSTQGADNVDDIESLNYYNNPEILNVLKETEDQTGRTVFEGGRNGGIGYVDPLYVRDETIRSLRWRPWYTQDSVKAFDEHQALDALLYALFPGGAAASETIRQLLDNLNKIGWTLPLVVNKGGNRFAFTRLPLEYIGGKARTDQQTQDLDGWDTDKPLSPNAGLQNVYDVLSGHGEGSKPAWRDRMLRESTTFTDLVLRDLNVAGGMPVHRQLLDDYTAWLGEMSRNTAEEGSREVWKKLLARIQVRETI